MEKEKYKDICCSCGDNVADYNAKCFIPGIPGYDKDEEQDHELCVDCMPNKVKEMTKEGITVTLTPVPRYLAERQRVGQYRADISQEMDAQQVEHRNRILGALGIHEQPKH